jgi:hypothetical protein
MSGLPFYFGKLKKTGESFSAVTGFFGFWFFWQSHTDTHLPPSTATPPAHINAPTPQHPALCACPTLLAGAVGLEGHMPRERQVVLTKLIHPTSHMLHCIRMAEHIRNLLQGLPCLKRGVLHLTRRVLLDQTHLVPHIGYVGFVCPAKGNSLGSHMDLVGPVLHSLLGSITHVHGHCVLPIPRLCRPGGGKANLMNESHLANRKERGRDRKGRKERRWGQKDMVGPQDFNFCQAFRI